ncbi:MAG TPA: lysylphosphatidylglycerol synthase transmembrane domain-containing protein [Candidatus Limnocylindrales bacterium]|nr:lysylphosphatidylglycerol synthase transmembrane domain-containing protein [Candidatus Limnocylindrales bacterium]
MRFASSPAIRAVVGVVISVVALGIAIQGVDLGRTADVLRSAAPGWIAAMLGFSILDVSLRAVRWQRLLAPIRRIAYPRMLGYLLVGYLANNVLPARLGELVRSHYLGDREGISRTTALGTVVVERVIDTTAVVLIASAAILVLHVRGVVANAVLVGLAVSAALVVGLAVGIVAHRLPFADRVLARVERWPTIVSLGSRLRGGLAVAANPRTVGAAVVLTLLAWSMSVLAFAAAGQAVGVELTIGEAAFLSSGVALATAIPSAPGYLGTFELAAVSVGQTFGIPAGQAFALALLAHAGILIVTSAGGAIAVLRLGWAAGVRGPEAAVSPPRSSGGPASG